MAVGIGGLFLEAHADPAHARCDGPSALPLDTLEPLLLSAGIPKVASPRLLRFCTGLLENPHLSVDFERLWERLKTATAAVAAATAAATPRQCSRRAKVLVASLGSPASLIAQ